VIRNYRRRVKQADELNEFAIAESLRGILVQEQEHPIAPATALGIDARSWNCSLRRLSPTVPDQNTILSPSSSEISSCRRS